LVSLASAANPFLEIKMDEGDILRPLIHSETNQAAEDMYRDLFRKYYRYELRSTGKTHIILAEIAKLTSQDIFTGFKRDDQEYIKDVVKNIFITHKYKINDLASLSAAFADLSIDYSARALQIALDKIDELETPEMQDTRGTLDDEVVQAAFDEFVSEQRIVVDDGQRTKILKASNEAFFQARQTAMAINWSIIGFKSHGRELALSTGKKLLNFVLSNPKAPTSDENKLMARKIMALVKFVSLVSTPEDDFLFMSNIGKVLTQDNLPWLISNKEFLDIMVRKILKAFANSSRVDHMRLGKEIFVSYFTNIKQYSAPTKDFTAFIVRKYRKSGLRFNMANLKAEYDRMVRIYAIDVVHTSMFLDYELLEPADIKSLLLGFAKLAENYSPQEQVLFMRLRAMINQAGPIINQLPLLFESLYDSLLHASQYYTHGYKGEYTNPDDFAALYDDYLDYMWNWKSTILVGRFWSWEPDPKYFPINILENYVFFKLINLTSNAASLANVSIKFTNFAYQNNYWIHKYTTEPRPRRLLNFLRNRHFPNGSFNYQHLRGLDLGYRTIAEFARYAAHADSI